MRKGITPLLKEKLVVALQLNEAIDHINTALRARKGELILDYTDSTILKLLIAMPNEQGKMTAVPWLCSNPRNHGKCYGYWPADPDLLAMVNDIMQRLAKLNAYLAIGVITDHKTQKKMAKLQCFFKEATRMAITLAETPRGTKKPTAKFEPPKEFAT